MEIGQVRYFMEVAAGGSFNQAAARLHYIDCVLSIGPESEEVAKALSAYEETKNFVQSARETHMAEFRKASPLL